MPEPKLPPLRGLRVPLHFKVMVSYLLVAGLVFIPTVVYVETVLRSEVRSLIEGELDREVTRLAQRLGDAPPEQLGPTIDLILAAIPNRVTIVDAAGNVLGDNTRTGLASHADRPEIIGALQGGRGRAERLSLTAGHTELYLAARFPATGAPRGVVRVSRPTHELDRAVEQSAAFFKRVGAVAVSAGLLLSLVAAFVVSRPLRFLSEAAQAYASGDFGFRVKVGSNDELGDLGRALVDLARHLRSMLIESGADRATLRALLDELPVGVIIFSGTSPVAISARARELAGLSASDELELTHALAELPENVLRMREASESHRAITAPIELPWDPGRRLAGTWIAVFGADGSDRVALVLEDREPALRLAALEARARALVSAGRVVLSTGSEGAGRVSFEQAIDQVESVLPRAEPVAERVVTLGLDGLCAGAIDGVSGRAAAREVELVLALPEERIAVVEESGRTQEAILALLAEAVKKADRGGRIILRGEVSGTRVKLTVRTPGKKVEVGALAELVQGIGGAAGSDRKGEDSETWIQIPKA